MELELVVNEFHDESPEDKFRRSVAAAITQTFSYMIDTGLEFGYICTGEAFIFLQVPEEATTVKYYLAVPKGDVGKTTWTPNSNEANRLSMTALGQVLAFTPRAMKSSPRNQNWRNNAKSTLKTWEVVYNDLLDALPLDDVPSSEYRPSRHIDAFRKSPVQLRRRAVGPTNTTCNPSQHLPQSTYS